MGDTVTAAVKAVTASIKYLSGMFFRLVSRMLAIPSMAAGLMSMVYLEQK